MNTKKPLETKNYYLVLQSFSFPEVHHQDPVPAFCSTIASLPISVLKGDEIVATSFTQESWRTTIWVKEVGRSRCIPTRELKKLIKDGVLQLRQCCEKGGLHLVLHEVISVTSGCSSGQLSEIPVCIKCGKKGEDIPERDWEW